MDNREENQEPAPSLGKLVTAPGQNYSRGLETKKVISGFQLTKNGGLTVQVNCKRAGDVLTSGIEWG